MTNRILLVGIAIVAIGMFALPETFALFSGQHNWYDTGLADSATDGLDVPCRKCHSDIQAELDSGGYPNTQHNGQSCYGCHIIAPSNSGLNWAGNGDFHAASAPACLDCHDGGIATNASGILNGPEEVHKPFAAGAVSSNLLKSANEACIGCHTHVAVQVNWSKKYMLTFNASEYVETPGGAHNWNVDNFNAIGYGNTTTFGNQSGETYTTTAVAAADENGNPIANP